MPTRDRRSGLARRRRVAAVALPLTAVAHAATAQPYFTGIGTLSGDAASVAYDVSANGTVVSGGSGAFSGRAVRWTRDGGLEWITPGEQGDTNGGISGTGSVIAGGFFGDGTRHAFRWTSATGAVSIGDLDGGRFRSIATGVSARGDIIVGVGSSDSSDWEAFRWSARTGMVGLGDLPGGAFVSSAGAISADGLVVVGGSTSERGGEAFRWTERTGMVGIGDLDGGAFSATATAVSADGAVVVGHGYDDSNTQRAFRWTDATGMVALPMFPNQGVQRAFACSWDGDVIVGEAAAGGGGGAGAYYWSADLGILWVADLLRDRGITVPEGWRLDSARGVSADGRTIVGYGVNPSGFTEGWVAHLGHGCRADFDESGSVSEADLAAYLAAWSDERIFTDWNYDGLIDTRDLVGFLHAWAAGC